MTPSELYRLLKNVCPDLEVESICDVETTCKRNGFCGHRQGVPVVDFDKVKSSFYKGRRSPASVDAVCVSGKGKYFCFVELKGWKNYLRFENKQKNSVEETVSGYHLGKKLEDSERLCVDISGDESLFDSMPVVFVLVTDIEVKEHGLESFADNMFALAETASEHYLECRTAARNVIESEIYVEHDYICCKDFDRHIESF